MLLWICAGEEWSLMFCCEMHGRVDFGLFWRAMLSDIYGVLGYQRNRWTRTATSG